MFSSPIIAVFLIAAFQVILSSPSNLQYALKEEGLRPQGIPVLSREMELANSLLAKMMETAYQFAQEMGASETDLKEVQRKRNIITACYFNAITCY